MESNNKHSTTYLEFEDNTLLIELLGVQESNMKLLEKEIPVIITTRGNQVVIQGEEENTRLAGHTLASLYLRLQEGKQVDCQRHWIYYFYRERHGASPFGITDREGL